MSVVVDYRVVEAAEVPAWDERADVVVVGFGAAGACAAIEAREAGGGGVGRRGAGGGGGGSGRAGARAGERSGWAHGLCGRPHLHGRRDPGAEGGGRRRQRRG